MIGGPQSRVLTALSVHRAPSKLQGAPWHIVEVDDGLPMPDIASGLCGAVVRLIEDSYPRGFNHWCTECLRQADPPFGR